MICEKCKRIFNEDWRKDKIDTCRFCSLFCSKARPQTEETKQKLSKKLNLYFEKVNKTSRTCRCGKKIHRSNKSGLCLSCKPRVFYPNNHRKNSVMSATYMAAYQLKRKMSLIEYKGGKCIRCGYNKYSGALEFHHRNPDEKEFNLSQFRNSALERLIKEVDKCDLLCANCHREVEHETLIAGSNLT